MSSLGYSERMLFESVFEMSKGYVLDLKNREFKELVLEQIQIDPYQKYQNQSKAKHLRAIISDFNDAKVGKLLLALLDYIKITNFPLKDKDTFNKCVNIAKRLLGENAYPNSSSQPSSSTDIVIDFNKFYLELCKLQNYEDSPQKRGFAFEKWLNNYFYESNLNPRKSFKILGEQIDGSFELDNNIYLLEAKWTSMPIEKSDLVVFNEKVRSKSTFTRGVFISYAGFSSSALETLAHGRSISIILMTVQEIIFLLYQQICLKDVLAHKIRGLAEEGNCFKRFFQQ